MSTSILCHGFGIYGYRYVSSQYQQGTIVFTIEQHDSMKNISTIRVHKKYVSFENS